MKKRKELRITYNISLIKTIAIISVITAHVNNNPMSAAYPYFSALSIIGVPLFLMLLGCSLPLKKIDFFKKINRFFICPWVFWATSVYFITNIFGHKNDFSIIAYLYFFIGYGSIYYYNTIYVALVFLFSFLNRYVLSVIISFSFLISILFFIYRVIGINYHLIGYLNVFYWIVFPVAGYLISKIRIRYKIIKFLLNISLFCLSVISFFLIPRNTIAYFSLPSTIFALSSSIFIFINSEYVVFDRNIIEKNTYIIYLMHLPLAGFLSRIFVVDYSVSVVLRVTIVLSIFFLFLVIMKLLTKNSNNKLLLKINTIIGVRY